MAAPVVQDVTTTDFAVDATSHAANMPATVNVGDGLVALCSFDDVANHGSVPAGWTRRLQVGFEDPGVAVYYKVADGTEDGTTVNFATDNAQKGTVQVYRITGFGSDLAKAIIVSEVGISRAEAHGLVCFTGRPAADILWITWATVSNASSILTGAAAPTGYGNAVVSGATGTDNAQILSARKSVTAVTDENPAANWDTNTISARYGLIGIFGEEYPDDEVLTSPRVVSKWAADFTGNTTAHSTPISPVKNQYLVAIVSMDSDGAEAIATPAGWSQRFYFHVTNAAAHGVYTKRADGSEAAVDFVTTNAQAGSVMIYAVEHCGDIAGIIAAALSDVTRHPISYFYLPDVNIPLVGFRSDSGSGYTWMNDWLTQDFGAGNGAANVGNFQIWESYAFPLGTEQQFPGANTEPSNNAGDVHGVLLFMPEFRTATLSGTVTLNGTPIQNASVFAHEVDGKRVFGPVLTDASGNYTLPVVSGYLYDVSIQYENAGQKYNALTVWGVTPEAA